MLYRLSLLLTGDHERAEQCFVAGLEDSVSTNGVFKEWARTWAKRTILQDAIGALKPRPPQHAMSSLPEHAAEIGVSLPSIPDRDPAIRSVLALEDFERFVFVITVLEGYSEHQCALLLNASLRDVRNARIRAAEHIATAESSPIAQPIGRLKDRWNTPPDKSSGVPHADGQIRGTYFPLCSSARGMAAVQPATMPRLWQHALL